MSIRTEERVCDCFITTRYLDPKAFLRIFDHPLRKRILHMLSLLALKRPVSKKELAKAIGIPYTKLLFQLNNPLKGLWKVEGERKKRGAHEELIAPAERNTVYIMLSSDAVLYVFDPLANISGKLSQGTRCRECPAEQWEKCFAILEMQECFRLSPEDRKKLERLLITNGRSLPFTPMDYVLACSALRSLEGISCTVQIPYEECQFLQKEERILNRVGRKIPRYSYSKGTDYEA